MSECLGEDCTHPDCHAGRRHRSPWARMAEAIVGDPLDFRRIRPSYGWAPPKAGCAPALGFHASDCDGNC